MFFGYTRYQTILKRQFSLRSDKMTAPFYLRGPISSASFFSPTRDVSCGRRNAEKSIQSSNCRRGSDSRRRRVAPCTYRADTESYKTLRHPTHGSFLERRDATSRRYFLYRPVIRRQTRVSVTSRPGDFTDGQGVRGTGMSR